MPLSSLQHVLIQPTDLEATKDWYVNVLGLTVGDHPDFKFPVYWLYIGDHDVLHMTPGGPHVSENRKKYLGQQSQVTFGSGVVDHIAFGATGLKEMRRHLRRLGAAFTERQVDRQGPYQIFLFDPNGVKVELNYDAAEAEGLSAEIVAADLA